MDKYYYYQSYHEALKGIKPATRYIIREAIDNYMFEDKEPVFKDLLAKSIWSLMLPTLKNSKVKYANGKSRGKTEANQEQNPKQTESKSEANLKQNGSKTEALTEFCPSISISISKEKGKGKGNNNPPINPPRDVSPAFERFWSAYPKSRRVGKQKAIKAFERALKITDINTMLDAIEKQKGSEQWRKNNGEFIPHPTTWLNRGGWDDEVTDAVPLERPKKPVPVVTQCPDCGSYDLGHTLDRVVCRGCGAVFDYNHTSEKWERA